MKVKSIASTVCAVMLMAAPVYADIQAGKMALEQGEFQAAIELFQPDLKANGTSLDANWLTGRAYVSMGKPKEALDFLEKAVELDPNHVEATYWWGAANGEMASRASIFSAPGYAKKCKQAFEKVVELDPSHVEARAGLVEYYAVAPGFVGGDKEKALSQAREVAKYDAEKSLLLTADVYLKMEKVEKALEIYDGVIATYPENVEARLSRGLVYREIKQYQPAFADFEALFEIADNKTDDEEAAVFIRGLGQYYFGAVASQSGLRVEEGAEKLEKYLEVAMFDHPFRHAYSQYYLATLYFKKGDIKRAKELAAEAKKNSDDKDLKKKLKKLRKQLKRA